MKKHLLLALCALFACNAGARTLYVDAKRPNNNGNGLSAKKAKKTIQAAINVAKKGDTILVYPGTYAPIKTNNKKIAIKSVKGAAKTMVDGLGKRSAICAQLAKIVRENPTWTATNDGVTSYGSNLYYHLPYKKDAWHEAEQKNTKLAGVTLRNAGYAVIGGVLSNSKITKVVSGTGKDGLFSIYNSTLDACTISGNKGGAIGTDGPKFCENSTLLRCKIVKNSFRLAVEPKNRGWYTSWGGEGAFTFSVLRNCLVAGNRNITICCTELLNCTIADNLNEFSDGSDWNRYIVNDGSSLANCILRNNFADVVTNIDYETGEESTVRKLANFSPGYIGSGTLKGIPSFKNTDKTNKNPKFANPAKGDYRLKKGSYCINKGKLTKAQKKLVGTKDLAGKKRIKGKAVDLGCYER